MTRDKTKAPGETPKPRKKLAVRKKTIRDLKVDGSATNVKGGGRSNTISG
jgi:hypothetical protein